MQNDNTLSQRELKNTEQVLKAVSAGVGEPEIENIDPQTFADMVLRQVRANMVMRDTAAEVNESLVGSAGSTIDYREIGAIDTTEVEDKAEFNETTDRDLQYDAVRVDAGDTKQVQVPISDETMEDANLDVAETVSEEIGIALAQKNDQLAYDLVTNESYDLDGNKYGGSDTLGDYTTEVELASDGQLTFEDIASLAGEMRQKDLPVDELIVSEDHAHQIVTQDLFHLANERGNQEGRLEGNIGRIVGLNVRVTSRANAVSTSADGSIQAVMLASDRAFVEAVKRRPRMEVQRKEAQGFDRIIGTHRYGHEIYDAEAVGYLKNSSA